MKNIDFENFEAKCQLTAIMNATNDAIIAATLERIVLSWNRGAERIFGYPAEEIIGHSFDSLIPADQISGIKLSISKLAQGETTEPYEATRIAKDGHIVYVEIALSPIHDATHQICGIIAIVRDISARKRVEENLQSRLRQQAGVAYLGQRALANIDVATLMDEAVALLSQTLSVELCKVLQLQPDGKSLLLYAGVGWQQGLVGNTFIGTGLESQAGYTLKSNSPVIVEDLRTEKRFSGPPLLQQHGVVSGMSVIIHGREQCFGVLGVHTTKHRHFTEDDIHFLQAVANILAVALQRSDAKADREARAKAEQAVVSMEADVHHRAVVMESANRVALEILASRTGIEALRYIAEAARVLAGARYAALGVAQPDTLSLSEFITVGLTPQQEASIGSRPKGAGVLGLLLSRSKPLRIDVLGEHPEAAGFPPNHPPMEAFLGVPIRRGDNTIGSLYLTNKQGGGPFTEGDEVAVQALGAHAAVAIHNLHLLSRQRALVSGLITAQEEERRTVAYDLHDGLTQYVMAAHAHLESFKRAHEGGKPERASKEMELGLKYLKEAVIESRRMVNGLRSLALDDLGLSGALEQLVSEEKDRSGWEEAELVQNIGERRFDKTLETGAYRIAQEALTNIRKHAKSSRVQIFIHIENKATGKGNGEFLRLQIQDYGQGFEQNEQVIEAGHFGLHGMSERVHLLGGDFELHSTLGQGTTIIATFPILAALSGQVASTK